MDKLSLTYLTKAFTRLEKYLPDDTDILLSWYDTHSDYYSVLPIGKYVYCLFALPVMSSYGKEINHVSEIDSNVLERITTLVYEDATIIADISGLHASMDTLLTNENVFNFCADESDWTCLEHYCLCGNYFPDITYPPNKESSSLLVSGEALLITNAYVTTAYRRQSIFRNMVQMIKDHALHYSYKNTDLYTAIALDPDIAQYGPDTKPEPYYYSFEVDEPRRLVNASIMDKLNFTPIRLEADEIGDGTKLWFALQHEKEISKTEHLS